MKTKVMDESSSQGRLIITMPGEVLADLKKIAATNKIKPGDLAYTYIIDGLATDVVDTMTDDMLGSGMPAGSAPGEGDAIRGHSAVLDGLLKELQR